ncbi:MAG: tetratricopeptide repeat protein [Brevinema sp.]
MEFNKENLAKLNEENIAAWGEYADQIKHTDSEFAENIYQKILSIDDEHTTALSIYADFLHDIGRFRDAKLIYTKLLHLEPDNPNLLFRFGAFCVEIGDFEIADKQLVRFLEMEELASERLMDKANDLAEQGKCRAAEWYYHFMLRHIPEDPFVFNNYALLLADLGRFNEAEEFFKRALAFEGEDMAACFNYANLLLTLDRVQEAEWYYDKALAADPEDTAILNNYVSLLIRKAEFRKAEMMLKRILSLSPADMTALQHYSYLLSRDGRAAEALHTAQHLLDIYPNLSSSYYLYASILTEAERLEEATEYLRKSIELDPENTEAQALLAMTLSEMGKPEESEAIFKQGLLSHNGDPVLRFHYAAMLFDNERYEDAERWAKALIESDPAHGEAFSLLGSIVFAQGRTFEARSLYEKALEKEPTNPEVWLQAAIFYNNIKDYISSDQCFTRSLELSPGDRVILDEQQICLKKRLA